MKKKRKFKINNNNKTERSRFEKVVKPARKFEQGKGDSKQSNVNPDDQFSREILKIPYASMM